MNKKYVNRLTNVIFLAFFVFLSACASSDKHEGIGEYVDDSLITTRVKAAILEEKTLSVAEINVETFKGVVQLSGFVHSEADRAKAVELTKSVKGVKSVKNAMELK
jgi:osmotically-inducible protein OsmY